jgi:hypothetical protein
MHEASKISNSSSLQLMHVDTVVVSGKDTPSSVYASLEHEQVTSLLQATQQKAIDARKKNGLICPNYSKK